MSNTAWHPYGQAYSTHNHPTRYWETAVFGADNSLVASSHGQSEEEANAIARLLAAAPDLLAELKRALAVIVSPQSFDLEGVESDIRAAIAKAEGKQ